MFRHHILLLIAANVDVIDNATTTYHHQSFKVLMPIVRHGIMHRHCMTPYVRHGSEVDIAGVRKKSIIVLLCFLGILHYKF